MTWGDLRSIVEACEPGSALYLAHSTEGKGWTHTDFILADLVDAVRSVSYAVAQTSTTKKLKKPKPYPRPGVQPIATDVRTFGFAPMPIADLKIELARRFGWTKPPEVS